MARETTQRNDNHSKYANLAPLDGRTPKEAADNLRKKARRIEGYRNRPEVRRAIARDPKILALVLDLERRAAAVRDEADKLESVCGDMTAAEFAALNQYTDEWARKNPEKAAELMREADKFSVSS